MRVSRKALIERLSGERVVQGETGFLEHLDFYFSVIEVFPAMPLCDEIFINVIWWSSCLFGELTLKNGKACISLLHIITYVVYTMQILYGYVLSCF